MIDTTNLVANNEIEAAKIVRAQYPAGYVTLAWEASDVKNYYDVVVWATIDDMYADDEASIAVARHRIAKAGE